MELEIYDGLRIKSPTFKTISLSHLNVFQYMPLTFTVNISSHMDIG